MELSGAHALLGRADQVRAHQPLVHGNVAVLENRADRRGELLRAILAAHHAPALPRYRLRGAVFQLTSTGDGLGLDAHGIIDRAALRADRAVRPAQGLIVRPGGVLVREQGILEVSVFHAP